MYALHAKRPKDIDFVRWAVAYGNYLGGGVMRLYYFSKDTSVIVGQVN